MFRFLREVYLTGFAIIFTTTREKDIAFKVSTAVGLVGLIQSFFLVGVLLCVEMYLKIRLIVSKPTVIFALFMLFAANMYYLFFRGHGVKFAHEFDHFKKSKRIILVTSFWVLSAAAVVFSMYSGVAFRRFIGAK